MGSSPSEARANGFVDDPSAFFFSEDDPSANPETVFFFFLRTSRECCLAWWVWRCRAVRPAAWKPGAFLSLSLSWACSAPGPRRRSCTSSGLGRGGRRWDCTRKNKSLKKKFWLHPLSPRLHFTRENCSSTSTVTLCQPFKLKRCSRSGQLGGTFLPSSPDDDDDVPKSSRLNIKSLSIHPHRCITRPNN